MKLVDMLPHVDILFASVTNHWIVVVTEPCGRSICLVNTGKLTFVALKLCGTFGRVS